MAVLKGPKKEPRQVECCAVGCLGADLDKTLKDLNREGWAIRQVYHEPPTFYRIFAQRETLVRPA